MNYSKMSDSELANIMVNYILRIENLERIINNYLVYPLNRTINEDNIKSEYKQLKNELREDAAYLDLLKNRDGSYLYMNYFSPSIREASAWGFAVSVNHRVNQEMFNAIEEAHYKLTKRKSLEQWEELL